MLQQSKPAALQMGQVAIINQDKAMSTLRTGSTCVAVAETHRTLVQRSVKRNGKKLAEKCMWNEIKKDGLLV